jgi:hypothetical protein
MKLTIAHRSSYLPLRDAVLCTDCDFISADAGDACAVCGSRNLLKLCDLIGQHAGPASLPAPGLFEFFTLQLDTETSPGKTSA